MIIKQISIFVEDRPGGLLEITETLAENNINIRALVLSEATNNGILRIIVDEPDKVVKLLKETGMILSVSNVLSVCADDKPGGLSAILKILADNNINIKYLYVSVDNKKAYATIRVKSDDAERASDILKQSGYIGLEE